ncbi:ATPase [Blastocladiella emersonii ATCC 22665]|nr:ATPase [Blastocladiella emersonii ATCC 22665]
MSLGNIPPRTMHLHHHPAVRASLARGTAMARAASAAHVHAHVHAGLPAATTATRLLAARRAMSSTHIPHLAAAATASGSTSAATASRTRSATHGSFPTFAAAAATVQSRRAYSATPIQDAPEDHRYLSPGGPLEQYRGLVRSGRVRMDAHQLEIVRRLQVLHDRVVAANPPPSGGRAADEAVVDLVEEMEDAEHGRSLWNRFKSIFADESKADDAVKSDAADMAPPEVPSLYMFGTVGTGKTFTMDLFYHSLPKHIRAKRMHFNQFMINVHARSHELKSASTKPIDATPLVAAELARDARVLCFDEFQVTNIADAMILRRLLKLMFQRGIVMVVTSNRHPDELYQNGLQRESFLPCIDLIKTQCDVVSLNSGVDYRKRAQGTAPVYFHPLSPPATTFINTLWHTLCGSHADPPRDLPHTGRAVRVPRQVASRGVARFTFDDLCAQPLAAADYLAIVSHYPVILVDQVPTLSVTGNRAELRRWITFIDAAYDAKACVLLHTAAPVHQLVPVAPDEPPGDEERFATDRTLSRLMEMQGEEWVADPEVRALVFDAVREARRLVPDADANVGVGLASPASSSAAAAQGRA